MLWTVQVKVMAQAMLLSLSPHFLHSLSCLTDLKMQLGARFPLPSNIARFITVFKGTVRHFGIYAFLAERYMRRPLSHLFGKYVAGA